MFDNVRWKLVGWASLAVSLILVVLGTAIYFSLERSLVEAVDRTLVVNTLSVREELSESDVAEAAGYRGGMFYAVANSQGQIVTDPQQVGLDSLPIDLLTSSTAQFRTVELPSGVAVRIYAAPLDPSEPANEVLVVGQSLDSEQAALSGLLLILLVGGGAGLLLSIGVAWFLAGRVVAPIRSAFVRQQEFVADASHELRTPLTILHSATDLLDQRGDEPLHSTANRPLFDTVRQEIVRMERLTQTLLTLARSDRGDLELSLGRIDVGRLAAELAQRVSVLAQERGVQLKIGQLSAEAVLVEGDPDRLHEVCLILIDNALEHTPRGGSVSVSVRREGSECILEVEDTGEGIAEEHMPRVFDRFYRADPARSRVTGGVGLGLAIARTIVDAHGGGIALVPRPAGGTRAVVMLPLLAAESPAPAPPE